MNLGNGKLFEYLNGNSIIFVCVCDTQYLKGNSMVYS